MHRTRPVEFAGWQAKAEYLDGVAWDDARMPLVRDMARRIALPIDPNRPDLLAHAVYTFVQRAIRYVRDPASEEFSDGAEILRQGFGDCDDKVRLFVGMARSVGLEARVRPVLALAPPSEGTGAAPDFVHVQGEVRWPGSYRHPRARLGGWLTAELILRDAHLGDEPQHLPTKMLV